MHRRPRRRTLLVLLLAAALFASREAEWLGEPLRELAELVAGGGAAPSWSREDAGASEELLLEAFRSGRSGVVLEVSGTVDKVLPDDRRGSRHQRFILGLSSGHTVLVSHNIDLAPRVEGLARGDPVILSGQYEWNERGGVVHWTHHDPDGRRPGGWIRHEGSVYR